jgi:hypothetical protein
MRCWHAPCFLVLLAVLALGCATAPGPSIEEMVRSAESPSDHMRIAEHYRRAAAEAREDAAEHERLAEVYGGPHRWGAAFAALAREHCNDLSASSYQRAAHYDQLASEHERLAHE